MHVRLPRHTLRVAAALMWLATTSLLVSQILHHGPIAAVSYAALAALSALGTLAVGIEYMHRREMTRLRDGLRRAREGDLTALDGLPGPHAHVIGCEEQDFLGHLRSDVERTCGDLDACAGHMRDVQHAAASAHAELVRLADDVHASAAALGAESMHDQLSVFAGQDVARLTDGLITAADELAALCADVTGAPHVASAGCQHAEIRSRIAYLLDTADWVQVRARTMSDEALRAEAARMAQVGLMEEVSSAVQASADRLAASMAAVHDFSGAYVSIRRRVGRLPSAAATQ